MRNRSPFWLLASQFVFRFAILGSRATTRTSNPEPKLNVNTNREARTQKRELRPAIQCRVLPFFAGMKSERMV
jgi:hypothetical protein